MGYVCKVVISESSDASVEEHEGKVENAIHQMLSHDPPHRNLKTTWLQSVVAAPSDPPKVILTTIIEGELK